MKIKHWLLFPILFCYLVGFAQPPETIYPGTVIKTGYANNETYGPFNIGFTFNFYGASYTQFHASSNGLISFGTGTTDAGEDPIPTAGSPNNFIAPFWDDLVIDGSGQILYSTIGAAGNRILIVQFRNMGFYAGPVYMGTFSVILFETSNEIQIQYRSLILPSSTTAHGGSATIGIENADGSSGIQYAYHNPAAIASGQAILFTPSGSTYNMNPDAIYEPVYLTTNLTLPEPGIVNLINPAQDATTGTEHTFTWNAATNTQNYSFRLSTASNLSNATVTDVGVNTSFNVSGLSPGTTYYWGVFASNSTGTTWCEVRKFTSSSTPPLVAVPATFWAEQLRDTVIYLNYTGGDASSKTAIIASLPAQGSLYQYNDGVRGSQITSVPANVTDAERRVIYASPAGFGNGIGSFNFKVHDATGDSPEAQITINVSPYGIPRVMNVAKGTGVEIQLDRKMSDPAGKHLQFTVKVNGSPVEITDAALKEGDPFTIVLSLATQLTGSESVTVSYTQGDVSSLSGGYLMTFSDQNVTLISQTITFSQGLTKQFHLSPLVLEASTSSNLSLTFSSSDLGVATITGNNVTFRSVGVSDITVRQAGNTTYAPAKYERKLTILKGDQSISFPSLPGKATDDPDFSPGASASSGLPVSYTSSNTAVATIENGMIHITGAGSSTITASQPGSSNYNPAAEVLQPLNVTLATGIEDPIADIKNFNIYRSYDHILIETLNNQWNGKTGTVKVLDLTGRSIVTLSEVNFELNSIIRIKAPTQKGLYLIEIRSGRDRYTRKIIL
jgi:hypothetical protein